MGFSVSTLNAIPLPRSSMVSEETSAVGHTEGLWGMQGGLPLPRLSVRVCISTVWLWCVTCLPVGLSLSYWEFVDLLRWADWGFSSHLGSLGKFFSPHILLFWWNQLPSWGEGCVAGSGRHPLQAESAPCWQPENGPLGPPVTNGIWPRTSESEETGPQMRPKTQTTPCLQSVRPWAKDPKTMCPIPESQNYDIINSCTSKLRNLWWFMMQQKTNTEVKTEHLQHYGFKNNGFEMLLKMISFFSGHLSFINSFKIFINCLLCSCRHSAGCWDSGREKIGRLQSPWNSVKSQSWRYWRRGLGPTESTAIRSTLRGSLYVLRFSSRVMV